MAESGLEDITGNGCDITRIEIGLEKYQMMEKLGPKITNQWIFWKNVWQGLGDTVRIGSQLIDTTGLAR
jgi:hypothetical protein